MLILGSAKQWTQYWITRAGERVSSRTIRRLDAIVNLLETGRWLRSHGCHAQHRVQQREQLFDIVGAQVGDKDVLYMEFGVWQGESIRYWSKLLRNPRSKLHGFDSFEGLPDSWTPDYQRGHFSLEGAVPQVDDDRVQFFKGWFQETLPNYRCPQHDALVLSLDADLYSSTIFVLDALQEWIVPGTYLYFDEFADRFHELRAFDEFIRRTGMKFSLLGVTRFLQHALFQRTS